MALPVTLEDAKAQLRLHESVHEFDVEIDGFLHDAAAWVEQYTGHILEQREVTETVNGFAAPRLRAWPIAADAAVAVSYLAAGDAVTVTGARIDVVRRPARLLPAAGTIWPRVAATTPVTMTFTAGYADPDDVPRNLRRAILVLVGAYDADREGGEILAQAEETARKLCSRYKVRSL